MGPAVGIRRAYQPGRWDSPLVNRPRYLGFVTVPLRWIELEDDTPTSGFPWELAVVRALNRLEFEAPVTFLIGENATGKSTLLEAIAVEAGLNPEGGTKHLTFAQRPTESDLGSHLRLAWSARPRRTFFLRAETFFNMATAYEDVLLDTDDPLRELHARSHGQQFLDAVRERFGPGGFFVMDEPEAALSFTSQLALMAIMAEYAAGGSQFIVATHSPVLLTMPGAQIQLIDDDGIRRVSLDDAPTFRDVRDFLDAPERYLHHLFTGPTD